MIAKEQLYRCPMCGNIVSVFHAGTCVPSCCGKEMELVTENSTDASKEKHVPVLEKVPGGYKVSVGSVPHPMEDKHYIEWIELMAGSAVYRKNLKPGDKPEAVFQIDEPSVSARIYCNLHGAWKNT
jgi:superoxide reductase